MSGTFKTVVIGTSLNAASDAVVRTGVAGPRRKKTRRTGGKKERAPAVPGPW